MKRNIMTTILKITQGTYSQLDSSLAILVHYIESQLTLGVA